MSQFSPCAIIPVYNHSAVLHATVKGLLAHNLPVILVNDGSNEPCRQVLNNITGEFTHTYLVDRAKNGGKGAALKDGLREARKRSFTHALQIDADGQHNLADIAAFMQVARESPDAFVCGYPVYDSTIPGRRFYGRYATHIWVWINTLSLQIKDSMCGFRVYPVTPSCEMIERAGLGNRMEFDSEFIVRWYWRGAPLRQLPTRVTYPMDGISHFRLWRDNALISWMHTRLFFGMLLRLPVLLTRKVRRQET